MIRSFYEVISDLNIREALKSLVDSLNDTVWLKGQWQFREVEFKAAVSNQPIVHSLRFKPKDILIVHNSNSASVTWNYSQFDRTHLFVTTDGPTVLRFFVGQYEGT